MIPYQLIFIFLLIEIFNFSSKEHLLKEFSKVNQSLVAIIFNSNDVKKLDYDIRFYNEYIRGETSELYFSDPQYSDYGKK